MTDRAASLRESQRLAQARGSSDPYGAAIRATRMPIVVTDARLDDHPIVFANDAFIKLAGYPREEIIGRNCRFLQGPDTDRAEVRRVSQAIADGQHVETEILNYRKDGSSFWNALFISPVFDDDGAVTHFFGSQVDMTARRVAAAELAKAKEDAEASVRQHTLALQTALDQKTVLLHEVDHRVKNNLQLISSLILLQSRRIADPETRASMRSMLNRVSALAIVHRNLFQADDVASFDVSAFIRDITADLADSAGRDDVRVELDLEPVVISASRAAAVALVVNELATNALKHAFPDRGGRIKVSARAVSGTVTLEIEDDGVGRRQPNEPVGFGLSLIELLAKQLSARVESEDALPGVRVRIVLPSAAAGDDHSG